MTSSLYIITLRLAAEVVTFQQKYLLISWFFYSRDKNIMEHQLGGHLSLPYSLKQSGLQMEAPVH